MNVTLPKTKISTKGYYYMKMIAFICMLIDHIPKTVDTGFPDTTLIAMNAVGRIAFPLFAWELAQCFHHTADKVKHLLSLLILAVISEPVFDLAFTGRTAYWEYQNVCFTLALGWLCLYILDYDWIGIEICYRKGVFDGNSKKYVILSLIQWLIRLAFCTVIGVIAQITDCDYGIYGIMLISLLGVSDKLGRLEFLGESLSVLIFIIFIGLRNDSIGLGLFIYSFCLADIGIIGYYRYVYKPTSDKPVNGAVRLFCKWFYPIHLLSLYIIRMLITLIK